jgi:two-component system, NtrC family, sensor kinase
VIAALSVKAMTLENKLVRRMVALVVASCVANVAIATAGMGVLASGALVSAVGALALIVAHFALFEPLRRLSTIAKAIGSGEVGKQLSVQHDEIGSLALALGAMCEQLHAMRLVSDAQIAALEQLRHSERIATVGQLASSVAQELGNPLDVIGLRARLIMSDQAPDQVREHAGEIVEQTQRVTRVLDEILDFVRMQPSRVASLDLIGVLRQGIALAEPTSKKHKTNISLDVPETALEITGDADKLLQVVVNLVINGAQAMPGGGTLTVQAREQLRAPIDDPGGIPRLYVCVDVTDHGAGIPDELASKIFQPFFSTKTANGGTGIGLSVAQGIAREHEGWISVESGRERGSTFKVHLPMHDPRRSRSEAE